MIPKETIDLIFETARIDEVVGDFVHLKKRGVNMLGNCPFHDEKTPSFTVNDEKEFYHCFSSGEHGNIFDFLMKTKSIGFGEAVRELASQAGMQPYRFSNFDKEKDLRFQNYKNIFKYIHERGFNGILGMEHGNSKPNKLGELGVINAYKQVDNFLI